MDERYTILIARYLSQEATEQEKKELTEFVSRSKEGRAEFLRLKNLWEASHPAFQPEKIDTEAALRQVAAKMEVQKMPPVRKTIQAGKRFLPYFRHIAAVLFVPLLATSLFFAWKTFDKPAAAVAYNEVTAPYGTMTTVSLPDGSRVWINTQSTLSYPSVFPADGRRTVRMTGEAYFEVHADAKHPFVVEVGGMSVTAKGTAFNINAYEPLSETIVTLVEGKVDVRAGDAANDLQPNQQLTCTPDGTMRITDIDTFQSVSWKEGILAFRDDPLAQVFKRLGQIYKTHFEIMDPALDQYVYRATFKGETLDQILRLLEISAPIRFEEQPQHQEANSTFTEKTIRVYKNA